jgi:hypothetical protein
MTSHCLFMTCNNFDEIHLVPELEKFWAHELSLSESATVHEHLRTVDELLNNTVHELSSTMHELFRNSALVIMATQTFPIYVKMSLYYSINDIHECSWTITSRTVTLWIFMNYFFNWCHELHEQFKNVHEHSSKCELSGSCILVFMNIHECSWTIVHKLLCSWTFINIYEEYKCSWLKFMNPFYELHNMNEDYEHL